MAEFLSLQSALEPWFETPLDALPADIRDRVQTDLSSVLWNHLPPEQRKEAARRWDAFPDPGDELARVFIKNLFVRKLQLEAAITARQQASPLEGGHTAQKNLELADLRDALEKTEWLLEHGARVSPAHASASVASSEMGPPSRYIPFPIAMERLRALIGATPDEVAAWIFMGPENGGLAAYQSANKQSPSPRFLFNMSIGEGYLTPLMGCWFSEEEVERFEPADRFISGVDLFVRWSRWNGIDPKAFIRARVAESRLREIHPTAGCTRASLPDKKWLPPLEAALFFVSQVEAIEFEDLGTAPLAPNPAIGSAQWRRQNATKAADARHNRPGGSRDKQRQIREIWASGKYTNRDRCAEEECAALDMSYAAARKALRNTPEPKK